MSEQLQSDGDGSPDYRVSHLTEDVADAFSDAGIIQLVAPFSRGGVNARVNNRVRFQISDSVDAEQKRFAESVLDDAAFSWTTGEPGEYYVLGREITDLRELRKGDRIHINRRRGPFEVYRVMERPPEILQRSDPAVTVELSNVDTDTDWMLIHWKNESQPVAYCRTKDSRAKRGYRYKNTETAEQLGRIGPLRRYSPSYDHVSEDYHGSLSELTQYLTADEADVHPSDLERIAHLLDKPAADAYSPEDANLIQKVMNAAAEGFERDADALNITSDTDREHAAENQALADDARGFATAFTLTNMDAVSERDESGLWVCEDCGKAFTNRFKFPTHRRDCPAREDGGDE